MEFLTDVLTGAHSLDALLGTALPGSVAIAALALTLAGVVSGLVVSRRPVEKETTPLSKAA